MRQNTKARIAISLCIIMILPTILSILPMTAQEVSAAPYFNFNWHVYIAGAKSEKNPVQIENGTVFHIGDYAIASYDHYQRTASGLKNVKYSSSNKKVATVDSKGVFTAKKPGKTTIKIKCNGKTLSATFKVVKKGSFDDVPGIETEREAAKTLIEKIPSSVKKGNFFNCMNALDTYRKSISNTVVLGEICADGFIWEGNKSPYRLAVPEAGRNNYLYHEVFAYSAKNNPIATGGSKCLKIAKLSATTKQLTIKTKKAVTESQILATYFYDSYINKKQSRNQVIARVIIYDKTANKSYYGFATLKKGSKKVKVQLMEEKYINNKLVYKKRNFKKGHTYVLGDKQSFWGFGKKFKVKS